MTRRFRSLRFSCWLLVAGCWWSCHHEQPATSNQQPSSDIILITIDTLRADSVGYAGNTHVKTPFLDSLAARGIVFTNAHAHNVVTLPSHVNILTGLYPWQHGVRDNAGFVLDPKFPTLASMLHDKGYATGAFVGAFPLDARFGLNHGFDVYDDNYGKGSASTDFIMQERPASAVLEAATKWWSAHNGGKRFMWVHLYDAHAPYRPPPQFTNPDPYLGEIESVDDALSKQLAPLIGNDTLVVVTGDHGEARGDHGELTHGLFAYESTLKIPLIVAGAGIPHRVEAGYVRHIDIAPTILGSRTPDMHGVSLLDPIGSRDSYFEALSASLNRGWAPLTGIIHDSDKYIELPISELYALPDEQHNVRDEKRREVDSARQLLASMHGSVARAQVSAEEAAQLRSLGYVAGNANAKASYGPNDDPKNLIAIDTKMHEVIDAYEHGDLAKSVALAREVVHAQPDMPAGLELLAFTLQQSEHVDEAIALYRRLKTDDAKVQLALLLSETGRSVEAAQILAPLSSNGPSNIDALNALGIALADQGKFDDAMNAFNRVLQQDPNNAPALQNVGITALRRDDLAGAQQNLDRALALNPRLPLALNTRGVVYARENDFAHAVEYWNQAVKVDPRQYDALFNIGLVEGRAGHTAAAREALQRFVKTAPPARYAEDIKTAHQALAALR